MSIFRHLPDDIIEIDGEKFDLELFLEVEPEYSIPEDAISREYDGNRHIIFTKNNQFVGPCPWEDGDRYLTRVPEIHLLQKAIEEDSKYIESLKESKTPNKSEEYPPIEELVIAMWEHFVEGKPKEDTINIVQEKRLKVKEKYSK